MSRRSFAASVGLAALLVSSHAFAVVIVQNLGGPAFSEPVFNGQSFTTPSSGGPWDDITFNFFSDVPPATPLAAGAAFLLDQEYLGTPADLSSSTPGFLGASTGITGGLYDFAAGVVLQPGTQYFVYQNGAVLATSGDNTISGGQQYFAFHAGDAFAAEGVSANFSVSGNVSAAVPEPSPLMMMATALLGFGILRRYRQSG